MEQNPFEEIKEIVASLQPEFPGYAFDAEIGYIKGPMKYNRFRKTIELEGNQAVIALKEPISRMAQRPVLLVEEESPGKWKLVDIIVSIEG